jgi:hypothetical protein
MALNKTTLIDSILNELKTVTMEMPQASDDGGVETIVKYPFDTSKDGNKTMVYNSEDVTGIEAIVKVIVNKTIDHLLSNLEITGIKVELDNSLNSLFNTGVPVPNDGGATLKATWTAGTANQVYDKATQSNDGIGLIK